MCFEYGKNIQDFSEPTLVRLKAATVPLRRKPRWFSENLVNSVQLLVDLTPESRVVFGEALDAHAGVVERPRA